MELAVRDNLKLAIAAIVAANCKPKRFVSRITRDSVPDLLAQSSCKDEVKHIQVLALACAFIFRTN